MFWIILILFLFVIIICSISSFETGGFSLLVPIVSTIFITLSYIWGSGMAANSHNMPSDVYRVEANTDSDDGKYHYRILRRMSDNEYFFVYMPATVEESDYYRIKENYWIPSTINNDKKSN